MMAFLILSMQNGSSEPSRFVMMKFSVLIVELFALWIYRADTARERKGDISMLGSGKRLCGRATLICAANIGGKNNSAKKKSSEKNRKFSSP